MQHSKQTLTGQKRNLQHTPQKVQAEHKETRKEVGRLSQQREVDGKEWGAYMAKAKERDDLLTRQIAQMADELK